MANFEKKQPQRIQLCRTKGWRKPEGAVIVSRPSRWGNPFKISEKITADEAVSLYRNALAVPRPDMVRVTVEDIRKDLAGRDLACWCKIGSPCHGDVLLEIANQSQN